MGLKEKLIAKIWEELQERINKYSDFIKFPKGLDAVKIAAKKALEELSEKLLKVLEDNLEMIIALGADLVLQQVFTPLENDGRTMEDKSIEYVKKSPGLRKLNNLIDKDFSDDAVSAITLACADPDLLDNQFKDLMNNLNIPNKSVNSEDFVNSIGLQTSNDFDTQTSAYNKNLAQAKEIMSQISGYLPFVILLISIIKQMKDWLDQNEKPSKYFAKAIQRKLRILSAFIDQSVAKEKDAIQSAVIEGKESISNTKDSINKLKDTASNSLKGLKDFIKSLDALVVATTLAYAIYDYNRALLQQKALEEFQPTINQYTCGITIPNPSTGNTSLTNASPQSVTNDDINFFSCPIPLDNVPSVSVPLNQSIADDVTCPIPGPIFAEVSLGQLAPLPQTSTSALYSYLGATQPFLPLVTSGAVVKPETPIWSNGSKVYRSPSYGKVLSVDKTKQEIVITDIKEPDSPVLSKEITDLNQLYQDLSNTELFIKDFLTRSYKPVLLMHSPLVDSSIVSTGNMAIVYPTGGIDRRYKLMYESQFKKNKLNDSYDKDIQKITGKDNVQLHSENYTTHILKNDIDKRTTKFYNDIKGTQNKYINQSQRTLSNKGELVLWDYYYKLYQELIYAADNSQGLEYKINTPPEDKVENKIMTSFTKGIFDILVQRAFIDGYSPEEIQRRINDSCIVLDKGVALMNLSAGTSYYDLLEREYETQWNATKDGEKALKVTLLKLTSWGKRNYSLSDSDKKDLRASIASWYTFFKTLSTLESQNYETKETPKEAVAREGSYIESFFNNLWLNRINYPNEIAQIETKLDEQSKSYVSPSMTTRDSVEYTWYAVADDIPCSAPKSPKQEYEMGDIEYWIKYCANATLASVVRVDKWGTGFPVGAIPFPTVYIPFKGFQLPWGVMVLGITVTGIYPFPFVMVGNLDLHYHVPLADPATIIKRSINAIKNELQESLSNLKNKLVFPSLEKARADVIETKVYLDSVLNNLLNHKLAKPKRDRAEESLGDRVKALSEYAQRMSLWTTKLIELEQSKVVQTADLYAKQIRADVLYKISVDQDTGTGSLDPVISTIEKTQAKIDKVFAKLNEKVDSIDILLKPLPVSTEPYSANFLFTLKNPKPIQQIDNSLDETMDQTYLNTILDKFDINKEALLSSTFATTLASSIVSQSLYTAALDLAKLPLAPKQTFPAYKDLSPANIAWYTNFLLPKWAPTGGGQYGFPGFPTYPI